MTLFKAARMILGTLGIALMPGLAAAQDQAPTGPQVFGEYGDWQLVCEQTAEAVGNCRIIQSVFDANGNRVSQAEVRVLTEGPNVALLIIGAPLETFIPAGVQISIDGSPEQSMNFQFCAPAGCFATIRLPQEALDILIKGSTADIALVPYANRDQRVTASFSLSGFTAAFEQLEAQVKPAQ